MGIYLMKMGRRRLPGSAVVLADGSLGCFVQFNSGRGVKLDLPFVVQEIG